MGDIPPQSYIPSPSRASKSTSKSRDDLSYQTDGKIEPMTKTVSRSVSMLAPWRPKHKSEGYEIDYSRRVNKSNLFATYLLNQMFFFSKNKKKIAKPSISYVISNEWEFNVNTS